MAYHQGIGDWIMPMNDRVKKVAEEQHWSEEAKQRADIEGWCEVNEVLLTHLDRYRFAQMQFCMPKTHIKKTMKHLKDCPSCRAVIAESQREKPPEGEAIIIKVD